MRPFTYIMGLIGMIAGVWFGYRLGGAWTSAVGGAFIGMSAMFLYVLLFFPSLAIDERYLQVRHQANSRDVVKGFSILIIIASAVLVVFAPKSLRGGYMGYADPFIPAAMFIVCLRSFTWMAQLKNPSHLPTQPAAGEIIVCWPLGALGLLAILSVFLWHTNPICISISRIGAGDYKAAIEILHKEIQQNPRYAMAYNNRGIAKTFDRDAEGAVRDFTSLIDIEPGNTDAYLMRGAVLQSIGRSDEAQRDFDEFLRLKPDGKDKLDKAVKDAEKRMKGK